MAEKGGTKNKVTILKKERRNIYLFSFTLEIFGISLCTFFIILNFFSGGELTKEGDLIPYLLTFTGIILLLCFNLILSIFFMGQIIIIPPRCISEPVFFKKRNMIFIKLSQIQYFKIIRKKDSKLVGIRIITKDNKKIMYKRKFLSEVMWVQLFYYLKDNNIKQIGK